ncbi:MAG: hypothetical protein U0R52_11090 [Solirubrobacterales bacterium]
MAAAPRPGLLDPSFGGDGIVLKAFGRGSQAYDVAAQGRKVVVAGVVHGDLTVARFRADGTPDPSFGSGDGFTSIHDGAFSTANAVVVGGSGKIAVSGSSDEDFLVARFTANGTPDAVFGGGTGVVTTPVGTGSEVVPLLVEI